MSLLQLEQKLFLLEGVSFIIIALFYYPSSSRLYNERYPLQMEGRTQLDRNLKGSRATPVQGTRPRAENIRGVVVDGQLLATHLRGPLCEVHGLLPHSDLHPSLTHCRYLVGVLLAAPKRNPGTGVSGSDDRADDDNLDVQHQLPTAQNLLRQIDRRLPRNMLRHGESI